MSSGEKAYRPQFRHRRSLGTLLRKLLSGVIFPCVGGGLQRDLDVRGEARAFTAAVGRRLSARVGVLRPRTIAV